MAIPVFFPASHLIVPNLWQWLLMIVTGVSVLFTIVLIVKLMQSERVSITVASISGFIMVGTSLYASPLEFVGAIMIIAGSVWMIKK